MFISRNFLLCVAPFKTLLLPPPLAKGCEVGKHKDAAGGAVAAAVRHGQGLSGHKFVQGNVLLCWAEQRAEGEVAGQHSQDSIPRQQGLCERV